MMNSPSRGYFFFFNPHVGLGWFLQTIETRNETELIKILHYFFPLRKISIPETVWFPSEKEDDETEGSNEPMRPNGTLG